MDEWRAIAAEEMRTLRGEIKRDRKQIKGLKNRSSDLLAYKAEVCDYEGGCNRSLPDSWQHAMIILTSDEICHHVPDIFRS